MDWKRSMMHFIPEELHMKRFSRGIFFILLAVILLISILAGLSTGTADIPVDAVFRILISGISGTAIPASYPDGWETIVLKIRGPVVMMALLAGAALSVSGASLQGLFRNPLVDPFIIGISAGGALGWMIALVATLEETGTWVNWVRSLSSFIGAVAAVSCAYMVARTGSRIPLTNLLLAGVAISAALTAATQFSIYYFIENPRSVMISLLGTCSNSGWEEIWIVGIVGLISIPILISFSRDLNAFSMGEEDARGLGVDVERSKLVILMLASLLAAVTVPFCGMIGFVGLMVPHFVRKLSGPDHRYLIPGSAMMGASFLILCDMFSRSILDQVIPLGIVTGFLGGIFFLYLMGRRGGK
jgi:iron complex transport system permease protein